VESFSLPKPPVWSPLLAAGALTLLNGPRSVARHTLQELAHHAVNHHQGAVLWCDGDHGFDPYDFAELNLERGLEADHGAERVLVKRCMTPFQWDTVLSQHLPQKLHETETAFVIAAPFDRLFSTDELADWEQEDYVRYNLKHLKRLAARRSVPILISVDMARWWRTHPTLAKMAYEAADHRWSLTRSRTSLRAVNEATGETIRRLHAPLRTLYDFAPAPETVPLHTPRRRRAPTDRWF
jgi:hypothetical protein